MPNGLGVAECSISRVSSSDLDRLITTLEVNFVKLAECLVSPGWQLSVGATEAPGIHYNLSGTGRVIVAGMAPIPIVPHTLLIIPREKPFRIEVDHLKGKGGPLMNADFRWQNFAPAELRRFAAGEGEPRTMLICGYFGASYGASIDLFATLPSPIVEMFEAKDQVDHKLKSALAELAAQEVGSGAMSAALLKQVLVTILRRSLSTRDLWIQRFSILGDPRITRAFADMVARPGVPHSIQSLSDTAALSRSAFMSRFTNAFGNSPMTILRRLRMGHAAALLQSDSLSTDQVATYVGYSSRSSFVRAFRKAYACEPSQYRHKASDRFEATRSRRQV